MKRDQLDRLFDDDEITPSAGFTASVMNAVRREAAAPPPIAFPWKRALPGIAAAALALVLVVVVAASQAITGSPTLPTEWLTALDSFTQAAVRAGGLWALGGLLLSFLCVRLSINYGVR
jgi:hypothetical protein